MSELSPVCAGAVVLWRGGGEGVHLWVILTDPDASQRKVVAVMIVTERPHTDKTVVIEAGEHPFVKHRSNVDYGYARILPESKLRLALEQGTAKPQPAVGPELLERLRAGLLKSSRTIHFIRDWCRSLIEGPENSERSQDTT